MAPNPKFDWQGLVLFLYSATPVWIGEGAMNGRRHKGDVGEGGREEDKTIDRAKNSNGLLSHRRVDVPRVAVKRGDDTPLALSESWVVHPPMHVADKHA
jgi:hypothetical protein